MEVWSKLGRIRTAESMFESASAVAEEEHWHNRFRDAPHGVAWFSSLHASSFPSDDPRACERLLVYKLLGLPDKEPFSRMLRATMNAGQAFEDLNVGNLDFDGRLLTPPATHDHQLRIEDADHWLTGSPDMIVLPPFWNRPHYVETKTKDLEVVAQMTAGTRMYDAKHRRQCLAGIGLANRVSPQLWPEVVVCRKTWRLALRAEGVKWGDPDDSGYQCRDHGDALVNGSCLMRLELEPLRTGSLLYGGRDRTNRTAEFFFEHDEDAFQRGLRVIDRVRDFFQRGELPPQPFGGKEWSIDPCRFCDLKREVCKPDHQAGVTKIDDTNGVAWAKKVYGEYDLEKVYAEVIERWIGDSGVRGVLPNSFT